MKAGVSSMFFGDMRASDLFDLLTQHPGASAIDLWYDTPFHLLEDEPARANIVEFVKNRVNVLGLEVVTHAASFDVNPIAYAPALQRLTLAETEASLIFASKIGAKFTTLHGGFSSFGGRVSRFDMILLDRFLLELLDFIDTKQLGITLCLENDAATDTLSRPLESLHVLEDLLDKYPRVGMTLDIAHVIKTTEIEGSCKIREKRLDHKELPAFLKTMGSRVHVVHMSCPNKYRTHGRMDVASDKRLLEIINAVARCIDTSNVPSILEYALEEFTGPAAAMETIMADAGAIDQILRGK
jgi:sugar phosphate isomerase/epimerase